MNTTEHSEIAPTDCSTMSTEGSTGVSADSNDAASHGGDDGAFPEVAEEPVLVPVNMGPHVRETDVAIGCTRLRIMRPFALSRLGLPYQVWDAKKQSMVTSDRKLSVRQHLKELSKRLACGTDLIFDWVNLIVEKGPDNVVGEQLLKSASGGGKGRSRLEQDIEKALQAAVYKVCVTWGVKPGIAYMKFHGTLGSRTSNPERTKSCGSFARRSTTEARCFRCSGCHHAARLPV